MLTLNSEELAIVCRGLRGQLKPEDVETAKMLGLSIAESRIAQVRQLAGEVEKLSTNINKERPTTQPVQMKPC